MAKKIKGNDIQEQMRDKLFVRTGEIRTPKVGDIYEAHFDGLAYESEDWGVDFLPDAARHILKPYIPWWRKLFRSEGEVMSKPDLVVYCTKCPMWFDTKNGWKALTGYRGIPICPACKAPLMQIDADEFYKENKEIGRWQMVRTWEWPHGTLWVEKFI